jgi:chromosomal replication initiator protein
MSSLDSDQQELWDKVREASKTASVFSVKERFYFFLVDPLIITKEVFLLKINYGFVYEYFEQNRNTLYDFFESVIGQRPEIIIDYEGDKKNQPAETPVKKEHKAKPKNGSSSVSDDFSRRYQLSNFVIGPCNTLAFSCIRDAINDPGTLNPIFLYAKSGLGKTHLLFGAYNYLLDNFPEINVIYVDTESFFNEYTEAWTRQTLNEFHNKYRNADILIVDDIQFFLNKGEGKILEDFFNTYKQLFENGKQIIISSDSELDKLKALEKRIVSRLSQGAVVRLDTPDLETRFGLVEMKALEENVVFSNDVINYLAHLPLDTVRDLEGAVKNVVFYLNFFNAEATVDNVKKSLINFFETYNKKFDLETIISFICGKYNVKESEIKGSSRASNLVEARQLCMYFARNFTDFSLPQIGTLMGGRDHSTVLYSVNKIVEKATKNEDFKLKLDNLKSELASL